VDTTTGMNESEMYMSIDKVLLESGDKANESLKHDSVMNYIDALEVN
jgi:hypothetical protein